MAERKTGRQYMCTSFRNSGRKAGSGVLCDDYSETSGCKDYERHHWEKHTLVRFPHDGIKPEELNGEVVIVQKGNGGGSSAGVGNGSL